MNNTLENTINSIVDDDREEQQQSYRNRGIRLVPFNRNLLTDICQSSSIFILLIIIAIIPILQILIGWHYFDACPVNPLISHYLIVAGIISLLLVLLISITQIMIRIFSRKMFDETMDRTNSNRATMLVGCGVCSIMCINLSLLIFLLGWTIVGWIWVIEVWHRVQYRRMKSDDYCHPLVYQFTFSLLLLITTFKLLFFCVICRKTCSGIRNRPRKDIFSSDET